MKTRRALFVSNLFPSATEPGRGRFNLDQLRALREAGLDATVVSPRPWFPGLRSRSAASARFPPSREEVEGFEVLHPRAFYIPLWKGALNGHLYGYSVRVACEGAAQAFAPDLLWASFGFPDAVGAGWVAHGLRLPFVVSVLGSDVNVSFQMSRRRPAMLGCFEKAACVFSKSARMRATLIEAGVDPARLFVDYNGVDRETFYPRPREAACAMLGVDGHNSRILFVGNLVEIKGVQDLFEAVSLMRARRPELVVVGGGPLERALRAQATREGVAPLVRFVGRQPRERVAEWMAASNVVALPSLDEGVPNVLLEAMASGRPVVATAVGGVPEIHPGTAAGELVPPGQPTRLAEALQRVLQRSWDEHAVVSAVERFSWPQNAREVLSALEASLGL